MRTTRTALCGVILGLLIACAPRPGELEPLPRHPFPRWVSKLEPGKSDVESVRGRFGEPDLVESTVMGGLVWRYRFAEVRWPDADPDRPVVAANGKVVPRTNSKLEDVGDSIAEFGSWLDWLMFYPPKQPRPVAPRWLPATIHALELEFDREGRLVRHRYAPEPGRAPIPRRG
ncbi:MAG: hypothetical protein R3F21_19705 [Myxococcota bacterium]